MSIRPPLPPSTIMDTSQIIVTLTGALSIAFVLWFFFGQREATMAKTSGGAQEITVVVNGGYAPDRIEVVKDKPVRLLFKREEDNPCTEQVVLGEWNIVRDLPQGKIVPVEFTPHESGQFPFHCSMNMVRGTLIVKNPNESS